MAKLGEQFRDLSTEVQLPPKGEYVCELTVEDKKSKKGKAMTVATYKISGGDFDGFTMNDYFTLETDTGAFNEAGNRNLKRMCAAVLGEERVADEDFDTEEVNGTLVRVFVKEDSFVDEDTGETVQSRRVKRVFGPA